VWLPGVRRIASSQPDPRVTLEFVRAGNASWTEQDLSIGGREAADLTSILTDPIMRLYLTGSQTSTA
jgi:hypothetical protein